MISYGLVIQVGAASRDAALIVKPLRASLQTGAKQINSKRKQLLIITQKLRLSFFS